MSQDGRDARIGRIAARQRTMVSAEQLYASGVSKRAIEYRVLTGRLHPEFRGVYSVGCGELPPLAREQAALLACGEHAFLTHHTSAFIWGLRKAHPFEVDVSVLGRSCASR
ncbi:MAG: type IV toxin-antitoxin system AbiEi family antitoxin domain-containing protein, partial [Solirubrobacterales bacterium]|nr:type IV toxin-antitoxin system AbiEi family antitoxin domain-containing protein [Solirubrobacterales bacterium]